MRPVLLKIKGINSFIEEQVIDFTKLMSYGLFGITGNTGSGKSTILDSIILALYDKIPRKSSNYINSSQKSGEVYFEFQINSTVSKSYIVERGYKKKEKDNASSSYAKLYEKTGDSITVLAVKPTQVTKTVEQIIGLNYEDFTRSVVLPQGKFSEFLSLQGRQRNDMLERIFGLEKIGENLQTRIKDSLKETESELAHIEKTIAIYGDITEKGIESLASEINLDEANYNILNQKLAAAATLLEENRAIHEQYIELQGYIGKMKALEVNRSSYEIIEARIADAEKAQALYPYYISLVGSEDKIAKVNSDINKNDKQKKSIEDLLQKAQSEYENKKTEREELLPQLIMLEQKINDAIKLNEELKPIKDEREKLLAEYSHNNKAYQTAKANLENIVNTLSSLDKRLVTITENKQESAVSPLKREAVAQGVELEKSIDKTKDEIHKKETVIKKNVEEIELSKAELVNSEIQLNENDKKLTRINESLYEINKKLSNLPQSLMDLKQIIFEESTKYKKAKEISVNLSKARIDLEKKSNEHNKLTGITKELIETHADYTLKLNAALKDKDELEKSNIAYILAKTLEEGLPCPVCGSTKHPDIAREIMTHATENLEKDIAALTEKITALNSDIYNNQVVSAKLETEINTGTTLVGALDEELSMLIDNTPLTDINKNLEAKEHEYKIILDEQKLLEKQKNESDTIAGETSKIVSSLNIKKATLTEGITKDEKAEATSKCELEALNKKYSELIDLYNIQKSEWNIDSFITVQKEISKKDKQLQKYEAEEKKIREELQSAHSEKEILQTQIQNYYNELQRIKILGQEKQDSMKRLSSKIEEVCQDKNPEDYLRQTLNQKKQINESFELLHANYEKLLKQSEATHKQKIELDKNKQILEEQLKQQNDTLNDMMIKSNVANRDFITEKNLSKEQKQELQLKYKKYIDDVKTCQDNILRLEEKLQGKNAHEINLQELTNEKDRLSEELNAATKNIAIKNEKLNNAKNYIVIINSYREKEKSLVKKQNLLSELKSVFIGSKFVEYIAESELQYISNEASQRLKFITGERYELVYEMRDFFIVDNFNGKISRGVETLSGGELFLASLALALALSSKIQLKSAPLEFFFLDEGFGSLDSHLLDVVVSSLENLKNQRLTVGLITHVDELKNRLPVHLSVIPPNHGIHGSKVFID